jgi:predicted DNA-binding transcriptional regulator AlpA
MTVEVGEPMTLSEVAALPAVVDLLTAARALGIKRTTAYALARDASFPCPVFRAGASYRVPTSGLLRLLGLAT